MRTQIRRETHLRNLQTIVFAAVILSAVVSSCSGGTSVSLPASSVRLQTKSTDSSDANAGSTQSEKIKNTQVEKPVAADGAKQSFNLSVPEIVVHQGASTDAELTITGRKPNASVSISAAQGLPESVEVQILDIDTGMPLTPTFALDERAQKKVKVRVVSKLSLSGAALNEGVITAPGPSAGSVQFSVKESDEVYQGRFLYKVTNIAFLKLTPKIGNERYLPNEFVVPAGSIPVVGNPSEKVVASVLHFTGGSATQSFSHQEINANKKLNPGEGYCPIRKIGMAFEASVVAVSRPEIPAACLPCPAGMAADTTGSFYNHARGSEIPGDTSEAKITCRK
ncbi:hypothetical protein EBU99_08120 [bacterium]|nr:hypothetical protein [bacterium]